MKIAVLGTGNVGNTIAQQLLEKGHQVMMGSRTTDNEKAIAFANSHINASNGTHAAATDFSDELIFNCNKGEFALGMLQTIGAEKLKGKILIDLSNHLDFANGMPPSLGVCNTDSIGETLQRNFPDLKVVKTLNTMNSDIMLNPSKVPGEHDVFISGNEEAAKNKVKALLTSFGWKSIIDLGDISTARGTEMLLPIWLRLWGALGTASFNFKIVK